MIYFLQSLRIGIVKPGKNLNFLGLNLIPNAVQIHLFADGHQTLDHLQAQACPRQLNRNGSPCRLGISKTIQQTLKTYSTNPFYQSESDPIAFVVHQRKCPRMEFRSNRLIDARAFDGRQA